MSNFKYDLFRYYGSNKRTIKEKLLMPRELQYLKFYRKFNETKCKLLKAIYRLLLKRLEYKTHIQIYPSTNIGNGFYIGHLGRVIIHPSVVIGRNVNIATGVTIGQESRGSRKGSPIIGDEVWIGTNSVIVGNIRIGDDVMIAPLSFVNCDVPSHSIVIGNPCKIVKKDNATEGYIVNKI